MATEPGPTWYAITFTGMLGVLALFVGFVFLVLTGLTTTQEEGRFGLQAAAGFGILGLALLAISWIANQIYCRVTGYRPPRGGL